MPLNLRVKIPISIQYFSILVTWLFMEIVEIWRNLEKNATGIMIFFPHYMWAENEDNFVD